MSSKRNRERIRASPQEAKASLVCAVNQISKSEEAFGDGKELFLKKSSWNARVPHRVFWTRHRGQRATWGCFGGGA